MELLEATVVVDFVIDASVDDVYVFVVTLLVVNSHYIYKEFYGNCQKLKDYYSALKAFYSLRFVGKVN